MERERQGEECGSQKEVICSKRKDGSEYRVGEMEGRRGKLRKQEGGREGGREEESIGGKRKGSWMKGTEKEEEDRRGKL